MAVEKQPVPIIHHINNEGINFIKCEKRRLSSEDDEDFHIKQEIKLEVCNGIEEDEEVLQVQTKRIRMSKLDASQRKLLDEIHTSGDEENNLENCFISRKKEDISWPQEDILQLINRMEKSIPEKDKLIYKTRTEKLKWEEIAFNNYTAEECKSTWYSLQKKMRKYRLLGEILSDAKKFMNNPKRHRPKQPLSPYLIFYLNERNNVMMQNPGLNNNELAKIIGQTFKNLPPEEREKYEKLAAKAKIEYAKNLEEYLKNCDEKKIETEKPPVPPPNKSETPFQLFYNSELKNAGENPNKTSVKDKCKNLWKQMSDKEKLIWINLAEESKINCEKKLQDYKEKHPEYQVESVKLFLTKEEQKVKERAAGKPPKPTHSAYGLYVKMKLRSKDIKGIHPKERINYIANEWKTLPDSEQSIYRDLVAKSVEQYKLEYAAYLESLPVEERNKEMNLKRKCPSSSNKNKKKRSKKVLPRPSSARSSNRLNVTKKESTEIVIKEEIKTERAEEPEPPPVSAFKYYVLHYHKGNEDPSKAWKALSSEEKHKYQEELVAKKQAYIVEFEKFLKSLSKEELEEFSKSRQQQTHNSDDSSDDDCESSSEGDETSEEDDEDSD